MSDRTTPPEPNTHGRWLGPVALFIIALGFYALTLCPIPFPGESIRSLLQHWGQHPFVPMDYPVWGCIQRVTARMRVFIAVYALNYVQNVNKRV